MVNTGSAPVHTRCWLSVVDFGLDTNVLFSGIYFKFGRSTVRSICRHRIWECPRPDDSKRGADTNFRLARNRQRTSW